jgi:LacI family gluconate utilization system Gnt-I transcriptional repressor
MTRPPTMRDVARLAGVSAMTVSRAMHNAAPVASGTRARIAAAIAKLGYVPDRAAGSLATRRSGFIAAVLPTLTNANFADTAVALTETIREANYQLLIGYTMYSESEEETVTRALLARRPEAIVVVGDRHARGTRQLLMNAGIPVVQLWADPARAIEHAVGFSNHEVGRAAARLLTGLGHRRIAAIAAAGDADARDHRGEERLAGFAAHLRERGLRDDLLIRDGPVPFGYRQGASAMAALLRRAPDVEAVFVISDLGAVGALMECQRRGVRVPDDVSLVGFGDFDIAAQCVPALTTVAVDAAAMGRRAGRLLLDLLGSVPAAPQRIDVGFSVIRRDSTAPRLSARRAPRRA